MRAFRWPAMLIALASALALAAPASGETPQELDARLTAELRSRNPAAADTFILANEARAQEKHEKAAAFYGRVAEMVPDLSDARRRLAYELLVLGHRNEAILGMRAALAIEASAWNHLGLARALVTTAGRSIPSAGDREEAKSLVKTAEGIDLTDPDVASSACWTALLAHDFPWFQSEADRFMALCPNDPFAHYFDAIVLDARGDREGARGAIEAARAKGLPDPVYRAFLDATRTPLEKAASVAGLVLLAWAAGILMLLGAGSLLSGAAVKAAARAPTRRTGTAAGLDATLRKAYRWVLWTSCAYYYVSIPLVIAIVAALGGGLIFLMLEAGHIPVKLLLIVAILTFVTLKAILSSLFVRGRDEDPGLKVEPGEHPRLRHVLDQVASRVGTRAVTNVYLTPGTEIAVMERGGVFKQLRGDPERCLILGIGALEGFRMRPFRAVLAHEYGHFSNRDTAGGGFAMAVRRSLLSTAVRLAQGGAAAWYNPAWLFVNGFYRLFLVISQGASRLQEVLADRWATFCYGAAAFKEGLRHVIDCSIRFDVHVNSVLRQVIDEKRALSNLYAFEPSAPVADESKIDEALEEAIRRKPTLYDSHPSPTDRFAWADALNADGGPEEPDDREEAWSLFDGREAVERSLTEQVRRNVQEAHGILIPGG